MLCLVIWKSSERFMFTLFLVRLYDHHKHVWTICILWLTEIIFSIIHSKHILPKVLLWNHWTFRFNTLFASDINKIKLSFGIFTPFHCDKHHHEFDVFQSSLFYTLTFSKISINNRILYIFICMSDNTVYENFSNIGFYLKNVIYLRSIHDGT